MGAAIRAISTVGLGVTERISEFGRMTLFVGAVMHGMIRHPRQWCRWRLLGPQLYAVGVATIPVVAITGAFIGMVLVLESFVQFERIGQETRLGGFINVSVTKQIGPVLAAVMVAGRVGCALAAELGTMRVTEQLDALRAMATDPVVHLAVPRFVACVLMTPILTIYSDLLGVWGGWLVTVVFYGVSPYEYWSFTAAYIIWWEPISGLIKSVVFGACIGLIACYKGFNCQAGASGVGRAATEAFVASFLAIIIVNLLLAEVLNQLGILFIIDYAPSPLG